MALLLRGKRAVRWEFFLGPAVFAVCVYLHALLVTSHLPGVGGLSDAVSSNVTTRFATSSSLNADSDYLSFIFV